MKSIKSLACAGLLLTTLSTSPLSLQESATYCKKNALPLVGAALAGAAICLFCMKCGDSNALFDKRVQELEVIMLPDPQNFAQVLLFEQGRVVRSFFAKIARANDIPSAPLTTLQA